MAALALLIAPAAGNAIGIDDVLPLYFDVLTGEGFVPGDVASAGLVSAFQAGPDDDWISAGEGAGFPIQITRAFGPVHQNPTSPTLAMPAIADSTWTIQNVSAGDLVAPLLVFVNVDPNGTYPIAVPPLALDGELLEILDFVDDSDPGDIVNRVFGVVALDDLAEGEMAELTLRYIAAGELDSGSPQPLPPLGVLVLGSYIPEPSTGLLVATGLLATAIARRRARAR